MPRSSQKRKRSRYVVFISYSSTDSWIAHEIKKKVEGLGAEAYIFEKDMTGGGVIVEEVLRSIDECHEAIVLISPTTLRHPYWVVFEVGAVRGQHKRVTPVLNNVDSGDLWPPAKDIRAMELNKLEQFLGQLGKRIDRELRSKK
jgi:hypothetical protein